MINIFTIRLFSTLGVSKVVFPRVAVLATLACLTFLFKPLSSSSGFTHLSRFSCFNFFLFRPFNCLSTFDNFNYFDYSVSLHFF